MQTKRVWIFIIIFAVLAAVVLAVPIPKAALDDGGTREYAAMTYRIVKWKKFYAGGTYEKTKVYFGKDLKKTLDELWAEEAAGIEHVFYAEITEINGSVVTVRPAAGTAEEILYGARGRRSSVTKASIMRWSRLMRSSMNSFVSLRASSSS